MTAPFIAEIRMAGFNFAPRSWALCDGRILSISQNTALFSLLGTTYGGNGTSTFALPDLRGRAPLHPGNGQYALGEQSGVTTVTLLQTEMPTHTHAISGAAIPSSIPTGTPNGLSLFTNASPNSLYATIASNVVLNAASISLQGGGQPHNNMQPYLAVTFIIALQGIFPTRN